MLQNTADMKLARDRMLDALFIARAEGLTEWKLRLHPTDSYCWRSKRIIEVSVASAGHIAMWLHEIAHAIRGPLPRSAISNHHDGAWGDIFTELVQRHCEMSRIVPLRCLYCDRTVWVSAHTYHHTANNLFCTAACEARAAKHFK